MNQRETRELNQDRIKEHPELHKLSAEVMEHLVNPKNYGKLPYANGIGQAVISKFEQFVVVYVSVENEKIEEISFGTNGGEDITVSGSIFTTMIKGLSVKEALINVEQMDKELEIAPKKQQNESRLILLAFKAAIENVENRKTNLNEEMVSIEL